MQTIRRRDWVAIPAARAGEKALRHGKANATPVDRRTWRRVSFMAGNLWLDISVIGLQSCVIDYLL
jgi:hypothetical protein